MPDTPQTPPEATALADALSTLASAQTMVSQEVTRMAEAMNSVSERLEKAVGVMEKLSDATGKVKKEMGGAGDKAEDLVDHIEKYRGVVREVTSVTTKLRRDIQANTATLGDAKKTYENILGILQKTLDTSRKNSKQWYSVNSEITSTKEILKNITAEQGKGNSKLKDNAKLVETILKNFEKLELTGGKLAGVFEHLGLGKMGRSILDINAAMGRSGRMERAVRGGERLHNTSGEIRARRREAGEVPRDVKAGFLPTRDAKGRIKKNAFFGKRGFQKEDLLDETGNLNMDKLKGPEGEKARAALTDYLFNPKEGGMHQRGPAGVFNRYRARKAMEAGDAGALSEAMNAGGFAEMGMGGLSKLAGPIGIVTTIGGAIKDGWDTMAKQNQKYEAGLGKGGIFTGNRGSLGALTNVKENLRSWGMNTLGITSERNLAVAQAMQENGLGLSGLATRQSHGVGFAMGEGAGTWGGNWGGTQQIAMTAMTQARSLGLTDVEGVQETLKMMQQYKMTLTGTQKFFATVGQDIRAAGISTTKYIQLIDDVSGQFDNMAKSINLVVGVLRTLGSTGTNTFDQIKDNMTSLLGTQEKTTEQSMYLYQQMKTTGTYGQYAGAQNSLAGQATQNYQQTLLEALKDLPGNNEDLLKAIQGVGSNATVEQMDKVNEMFTSRMSKLNVAGTPLTQLIGPALQQATNARLTAGAIGTGNPMTAAFAEENLPANPLSKMVKNYAAFNEALKASGIKGGMGDSMKSPEGALQREQTGVLSRAGAAFGLSPEDMKHMLNARSGLNNISDTVVDTIQQAAQEAQLSPEGFAKKYDGEKDVNGNPVTFETKYGGTFEKLFGSMAENLLGGKRDKSKTIAEQFLGADTVSMKDKYRGGMNAGRLAELVDPNNNVNRYREQQHQLGIDEQIKNMEGVASATRTSNDLLEGIKDALVNKVSGLLLGIFTQGKGAESKALASAIVDGTDSTVEANQSMVDKLSSFETDKKKIYDQNIAQYGFGDAEGRVNKSVSDIAQGYRDSYQKLMDDQADDEKGE